MGGRQLEVQMQTISRTARGKLPRERHRPTRSASPSRKRTRGSSARSRSRARQPSPEPCRLLKPGFYFLTINSLVRRDASLDSLEVGKLQKGTRIDLKDWDTTTVPGCIRARIVFKNGWITI